MVKLLIADDHVYITDGVEVVLEGYDIDIVGKANCLEDLYTKVEENRPDVILLDINFGQNKSGIDFAEEINKSTSTVSIVMFSQYDSVDIVKSSFEAGVKSFLTKNVDPKELYKAIQSASEGKLYLTPDIANKLAINSIDSNNSWITHPSILLSKRELKVFKKTAEGLTRQEIADEMGMALRTITADIAKCKEKLHIERNAEFTMLAIKYNLITLENSITK